MKKRILIILGWLVLWQLLAVLIHNDILLVGPLETLQALAAMLPTAAFWRSIQASFLCICGGFVLGSATGILLAAAAYRYALLGDILAPLILLLKAVPVASFVILVLIWAGSRNLAFVISFVVVFPMLYLNTLNGLKSTDRQLLEMVKVFRVPLWSRIRYVYAPSVRPFLISGFQLALGMSWKSGVAAEVIGQPLASIGNGLYRAKIYLNSAEVFAWTIVIILISWLFEKGFLLLFALLDRQFGAVHGAARAVKP